MNSIWKDTQPKIGFAHLNQNKNRKTCTDVLIIGGGIAGILCGYYLKKAGEDWRVVEANEICSGVTKNTTAKITFGHGLIYDTLIDRFGKDRAKLYLSAQQKALDQYKHLCGGMDCDFQIKDNYVYSLTDKDKIKKEVAALRKLGVNAQFCKEVELPFEIAGAVKITEQGLFHPLKFLNAIAKELPIYENTKVRHIMPHKVLTDHGEIAYKKLIVATHFPILNKHGLYPLKLYQHRSYVIALQGAKKVEGMYVDESNSGLSFRSYGDLLLLGGGGHRTGKQGGGWKELETFAEERYKNAKIVGKWATQDCMTLDGVPYIGQYAKSTPNIFVATGFNKWGMTNAMVSANLLRDLVLGKENKYTEVFDPSRTILRPQLALNAIESMVGLLTPTAPRCPHLGCALKYNRAEHSWDCPCHGSRFTEKGELIDNPATDDHSSINHK